ncbi:MAG: acyl-CoA dehydrogenase [Gammaproteobacteria bacterium CG11_big_fil_rev_8_21_14_0_20_46_22]|nr:MAG: acyl-CoA dehydrogenase [Gammaproteobacteria bacterium CG12_big_fil_rev_8_21_14_0_65_46_12]PIR10738.1 MAG: acyl-CoA dehydrogenase [Gammaproteobacteria bacterium CG11_big_fil_rev_8_21_14_0_20_46_22]
MVVKAGNAAGREAIKAWRSDLQNNVYSGDVDFQHTVSLYLDKAVQDALVDFGEIVAKQIEPLVELNNERENLPRLKQYDGAGDRVDHVEHHPSYVAVGDLIYGSKMLARLRQAGGLTESLAFFYLSGQAGEAGHNCPFACSAGIVRVLQKVNNVPNAEYYLDKLTQPSFSNSYTGAQFLTEIQGGSDVGKNACQAYQDEQGHWRISGEKWFCSNANADLILMTARFDENQPGTKGLGLFLVPAVLEDGARNGYFIRRLKEKIGTRTMASGEIDFEEALAYPVGELENGFKLVMENVLHLSRLCNTACILGMARRAYTIARAYAKHREAFGQAIIHYPLVQENLARIKVENTAMTAGLFATLALQDVYDLGHQAHEKTQLLLRLLANLNKYLSAKLSVEHIHHCLDVLAGNGAIETFSAMPRLFRDSIVCENWEGTHNTLFMQTLRDCLKLDIDRVFSSYVESELAKLYDPRKAAIEIALAKFVQQGEALRQSEPVLQSLLIKNLVYEMGLLFSGLHLLREAYDQDKAGNKSACFDYFSRLHFERNLKVDESLLGLIQAVL